MAVMSLYVRQQENHRCIAQSFGLCGRGQGWDDLGEGHCILSYVKQIASPGSMHGTVCSGHVHWDDPEGWDGKEVAGGSGCRTHVHPWLIHVNVWQKHYNIVK